MNPALGVIQVRGVPGQRILRVLEQLQRAQHGTFRLGPAWLGQQPRPRIRPVLAAISQGQLRSQLALARHLGVDKTLMTYLLDKMKGPGWSPGARIRRIDEPGPS